MPEQIQTIIANLRSFGPRRLGMMAAISGLVLATIGIGSFYLNRPAYETLYVGLERADVNQIGLVLGEAGIDFDVGSDGTTVLVPAGSTGAGAHAACREGPADQRQCRLRAVRQCRLARPDLLHAAGDAGARARRRDRPHHPVDPGHQGGARPHRHGRARQLPPRRAAAVRLRRHPRRRHRRRAQRDVDPPSGRGRRSRPQRRQGDRARFQRHAARRRRRSRTTPAPAARSASSAPSRRRSRTISAAR